MFWVYVPQALSVQDFCHRVGGSDDCMQPEASTRKQDLRGCDGGLAFPGLGPFSPF